MKSYLKAVLPLTLLACFISLKAQTVIHLNINQPLPLMVTTGDSAIYCTGGSPAQLNVIASGGTSSYTYSWYPTSGLNNPTIANPQASPSITTTYTIQVTDANGCSNASIFKVKVDVCAGVNSPTIDNLIRVFPNPGIGLFTIQTLVQNGSIVISNALGEQVYESQIKANVNQAIDISNEPSGVYFLKISSTDLLLTQKLIIQ